MFLIVKRLSNSHLTGLTGRPAYQRPQMKVTQNRPLVRQKADGPWSPRLFSGSAASPEKLTPAILFHNVVVIMIIFLGILVSLIFLQQAHHLSCVLDCMF